MCQPISSSVFPMISETLLMPKYCRKAFDAPRNLRFLSFQKNMRVLPEMRLRHMSGTVSSSVPDPVTAGRSEAAIRGVNPS